MWVIVLLVVLLAFHMSVRYKNSFEPFVDNPCQNITDCTTCAEKQECTWCTSSKQCLSREEIKGDTLCNQVNLVHMPNLCSSDKQDKQSNHIDDKKKPPNVFLNDEAEYTTETVMAETTQLRKELKHLQDSLPSLMAQTAQMRPMVKGIMCAPFR